MDEQALKQRAKKIYDLFVNTLDEKEWSYDGKEEDLVILSGFQGDDIPIKFIVKIDAKREVVQFISPMPFKMAEQRRIEGAMAVCVANWGIVNGHFDYNINDGQINFVLTTSYCGCEIGKEFLFDMLQTAIMTTDHYNDRFMNLSKGNITLQGFIDQDSNG